MLSSFPLCYHEHHLESLFLFFILSFILVCLIFCLSLYADCTVYPYSELSSSVSLSLSLSLFLSLSLSLFLSRPLNRRKNRKKEEKLQLAKETDWTDPLAKTNSNWTTDAFLAQAREEEGRCNAEAWHSQISDISPTQRQRKRGSDPKVLSRNLYLTFLKNNA